MSRLVIIDSHSLIHRAYHALPKTFTTKDGKTTNAVFGFTRMLLKLIDELEPAYLAATFDSPGPTFRTEMAPTYKAHRKPADKELVEQFAYVEEVVEAMGIHRLRLGGYEADDLIATLVAQFGTSHEVVIVTGDSDLMQLVNNQIRVYYPTKGISTGAMFGHDAVVQKFSLEPQQIVDYKALRGDPSDNIPGVPGIGDKTATDLLQRFGTLEGIYAHLDEVTGRPHTLLTEHKEEAELSKKLASLEHHVPIETSIDQLTIDFDPERVRPVFEAYQFTSLLRQLAPPEEEEESDQLSLL